MAKGRKRVKAAERAKNRNPNDEGLRTAWITLRKEHKNACQRAKNAAFEEKLANLEQQQDLRFLQKITKGNGKQPMPLLQSEGGEQLTPQEMGQVLMEHPFPLCPPTYRPTVQSVQEVSIEHLERCHQFVNSDTV